jgi:hypothetical protein
MLKHLKRWFASRANALRWKAIADWADGKGAQFKLIRDGQGFVVEHGEARPRPWRMEWGSSQRGYIEGPELRLRCELKLSPELQMMVVSRQLMEQLESSVFEMYTDTLKTRVDTDTPEEVRWLVMFPKFAGFNTKLLRSRFGAVCMSKDAIATWLQGPFGTALEQACESGLLAETTPLVLLTQRGNLYLRMGLAEPDLTVLDALLKLFEVACVEAQRANGKIAEGGWPTTSSIAWQSQPGEEDPISRR